MKAELEATDLKVLAAAVNEGLADQIAELKAEIAELKVLLHKALNTGGAQPTEKVVLSRKEMLALTGLKSTTQWRMEDAGDFPARFETSPRRVGWRRSEVMAWIANRPAA
ncbi:MAG: AlpA family phage regulatory protein [Deltaproteobacteria bacterium]|nr:MAG: AlpA family phage regulatory protein [Deltaproteobacteria bacterium]